MKVCRGDKTGKYQRKNKQQTAAKAASARSSSGKKTENGAEKCKKR